MNENIYSQFCIKECPIGKKECKKLLDNDDSIFDVIEDIRFFVDNCSSSCEYREARRNFDKNDYESY